MRDKNVIFFKQRRSYSAEFFYNLWTVRRAEARKSFDFH